jgi:hypothetical protein
MGVILMEFGIWLSKCDDVVESTLGLSLHDMPDALWRDYFDDGLDPDEAVDCAKCDYWQDELSDLYG